MFGLNKNGDKNMDTKQESGFVTWLKERDYILTARLLVIAGLLRIVNFFLYLTFGLSEITSYLDIISGLCLLLSILFFPYLRREWDNNYKRKHK